MSQPQTLDQFLLEQELVSPQALEQALAEQRRTGEFLGSILARQGAVSEQVLVPKLAGHLGMAHAMLADVVPQPEALARVPVRIAGLYNLLPLRLSHSRIEIAIADPFDVQRLDELRLLIGCEITPVLAGALEIREAIRRHYGLGASAVEHFAETDKPLPKIAGTKTEELSSTGEETSVISLVNQLILQAVQDRATDIHLEPFEDTVRFRERVDGILYDLPITKEVVKLFPSVVSRIKVMSNLDIAERRLPQDGRMKVRLPRAKGEGSAAAEELDLRVSILPMSHGEGVVIRILSSNMVYAIEKLGLADDHLQILASVIAKPHGIILVTGPTGSGKTTTLYACLSRLNVEGTKILTIEDPIEYQIKGINQMQVHPKIGLTFAQGLRSMLRHDPDIMMVGEIRDPETAEITIRSALTGHLVFSTLHTNDAAGGVTRLLDMGTEPYLIASSVLCFVAQRLVRLVCQSCAEAVAPPSALREDFGVATLPAMIRRGKGCSNCKGSGYKGRTAIYEFLPVDEAVQQSILQRSSSHDIGRLAQTRGMRTLRQDGWQKIVHGLTTPEEVLRVT